MNKNASDKKVSSIFNKYGKEIVETIREVLRSDILDRYDNEEYWDYDLLEEFVQDFLAEKGVTNDSEVVKEVINKALSEV